MVFDRSRKVARGSLLGRDRRGVVIVAAVIGLIGSSAGCSGGVEPAAVPEFAQAPTPTPFGTPAPTATPTRIPTPTPRPTPTPSVVPTSLPTPVPEPTPVPVAHQQVDAEAFAVGFVTNMLAMHADPVGYDINRLLNMAHPERATYRTILQRRDGVIAINVRIAGDYRVELVPGHTSRNTLAAWQTMPELETYKVRVCAWVIDGQFVDRTTGVADPYGSHGTWHYVDVTADPPMLVANWHVQPDDDCSIVEPQLDATPTPIPVATPVPVSIDLAEVESVAVEFVAAYYELLARPEGFDIEGFVGTAMGEPLEGEMSFVHQQALAGNLDEGLVRPDGVELAVLAGEERAVAHHPDPTLLVRVCVAPSVGAGIEPFPVLVNVTSTGSPTVVGFTIVEGRPCELLP